MGLLNLWVIYERQNMLSTLSLDNFLLITEY